MHVVLATRSADKAREVRQILGPLPGIVLRSLDELGIPATPDEDTIECHETFYANAVAKARFFLERTGSPSIADDSGIRVDALGGQPGVRSKRYAADAGRVPGPSLPATPDELNNQLLLERLRDVPPERRGAHFACAAAIAFPDGRTFAALGTSTGRIAAAPRGTAGFGYDSLFLVPDLGLTFAQLSAAQKNAMSHRARAFRALAATLVSSASGLDPSPSRC